MPRKPQAQTQNQTQSFKTVAVLILGRGRVRVKKNPNVYFALHDWKRLQPNPVKNPAKWLQFVEHQINNIREWSEVLDGVVLCVEQRQLVAALYIADNAKVSVTICQSHYDDQEKEFVYDVSS
jgi:hypothetical protein